MFQPVVQEWLKVKANNENCPLLNYLCLSLNDYRRRQRHDGLPILSSVIRRLVKIGFDVNRANSYGETPLFLAVANQDALSVRLLIDLGADVNTTCCVLQEAVIHQACLSVSHIMFDTLLSVNGLQVNIVNVHGWSPLHISAMRGDTYKVEKLLQNGGDVTVLSQRGDPPIFFSLQPYCESEETSTFVQLYKYIENKVPELLHHKNRRGESLLDCAVRHQNVVGIRFLMEREIFDFEKVDDHGRNLLHLSVIHAPNSEILRLLIENGLSPNAQDKLGNTPLMYFFKQSRPSPHVLQNNQHALPNMNV
eukprot:sb/3467180/